MASPAKWGTTQALSQALPTEKEIAHTNSLIEELRRQNNYESAADTQKRTVVLTSLQKITEAFVKQVTLAQKKPLGFANAAGGRIFTYGSFRLGVFGPGSDIDTLIVAPKHVTYDDYFNYFPDLLYKMAPEGSITELSKVPDAFVPIIKFEYSGISIDLIFCNINHDIVPPPPQEMSLLGMEILDELDETQLRCINGTRVTDEILTLVPQQGVFKTALRVIKLWAQRRAIYANVMGFPGGVAWAMLVARVCQLYPKAAASTIILKFFRIMERWQWPMPVQLKEIEKNPTQDKKIRTWNPQIYYADRNHIMPIITPSYPSMCATHNVTRSTLTVIQREFKRGGNITDQVMSNKAAWKELFMKNTFFTKDYKYYLSVIAASTSEETQLMWSGAVGSKVRLLVGSLDEHPSIATACPFNKGFERQHRCQNDEEVEKAKTCLEYQVKPEFKAEVKAETADVKQEVDGEVTVKDEADDSKVGVNGTKKTTTVYTSTWYIGLELKDPKTLDLSLEVAEFKKICWKSKGYDQELMAINVIHTRNCDLPDDVFSEGEVKPTRSSKKSKKRAASGDSGNKPAKRQQSSVTAAAS